MTNRGKKKDVIKALNRPLLIWGMPVAVLIGAVIAAALCFVFVSKMASFLLLVAIILVSQWVTRRDQRLPHIYLRALRQSGSYDPLKYTE